MTTKKATKKVRPRRRANDVQIPPSTRRYIKQIAEKLRGEWNVERRGQNLTATYNPDGGQYPVDGNPSLATAQSRTKPTAPGAERVTTCTLISEIAASANVLHDGTQTLLAHLTGENDPAPERGTSSSGINSQLIAIRETLIETRQVLNAMAHYLGLE